MQSSTEIYVYNVLSFFLKQQFNIHLFHNSFFVCFCYYYSGFAFSPLPITNFYSPFILRLFASVLSISCFGIGIRLVDVATVVTYKSCDLSRNDLKCLFQRFFSCCSSSSFPPLLFLMIGFCRSRFDFSISINKKAEERIEILLCESKKSNTHPVSIECALPL